jgi:hypothetical protein
MSVERVQASNCVTVQHYLFEELHQTFEQPFGPNQQIHAPMNGISSSGWLL